jgi:arsenate reductase-like glutaredoxin family protein
MADAASRVIVAKGKKVREFQLAKRADAEVVDAMLGPTGNLRAPTIRRGKTLLVGFDEDAYTRALL